MKEFRAQSNESGTQTVRVRVTKAQFSDGYGLTLPPEGMVLLVGPNNAGKSQTLKDLVGFARDSQYQGRTLSSVEYGKRADSDIQSWAARSIPQIDRGGINYYQVEGWGTVTAQQITEQWGDPIPRYLTGLFLLHADGTSRLTAGDSQPNLDYHTEVPAHPVQRAYVDPRIEHDISVESTAAFGLGVTVDRYNGSTVTLRLGERPEFDHTDGRPTSQYLAALKSLPRLEEQGDGVRSYLGLVLHLAAGNHQVLLIDEPEAFLHPPQARRLGSVLAAKARSQQAVVATHSTDVVQGALEVGGAVTIVRITRDGSINHPAVLDDSAVKKLWSDPLLRYSNVLDGLFHDAVVLCESDADCRYYSAVLDGLPSMDGGNGTARDPQLLFTHCGGKARMHSVVDALRAVEVPVVVVADFDVLRNSADVKRIITSLGGDFSEFESDLRVVSSALTSEEKPLRRTTLKDELVQRLDDLPSETLSQEDVARLREIIKSSSGWDKAKRSGVQAVPQGEAYQACDRLLSGLRRVGLCVVPVGELERFAPGVPGHGPSWVSNVLEQKLHESPGSEAREFVIGIRDLAAARSL